MKNYWQSLVKLSYKKILIFNAKDKLYQIRLYRVHLAASGIINVIDNEYIPYATVDIKET